MENEMVSRMNRQGAEAGKMILRRLTEICRDPKSAQNEFLMKLLKDNENTEYGRKYRFAEIKSVEDYRRNVPVITYEDIDEYVERMAAGEKDILTAYEFKHMNTTSGTVGKQKKIPLTDKQSEVFMKYSNQLILGVLAEGLGESWFDGRSFCTSEGTHTKLPSGITVGCASSVMADICKGGLEPYSSMLKSMYTSPPEAMSAGPDLDSKYIHLRFALADRNLTGITSGFISNLASMLKYIRDNYELLIDDIEKGTVDESVKMPEETRKSLLAKIEPMPERAAELREIFRNGSDFPFVPEVWPKLAYIACAGGDGFAVYDDVVKNSYTDGKVHRLYYGVTSSEGLWSVPIAVDHLDGVLVPDGAFMEFLPVEAEDDFSQVKGIDELEVGKTYELIITNLCGFYRYRMSDAVQVTGFYENTPLVRFMYRVNKTINLACEKTTEQALLVTAQKTAKDLNLKMFDFEVYPDPSVFPPRYVFMIETEDDVPSRISKEELDAAVLRNLREANDEFRSVNDKNQIQNPDCWFEQAETQLLYMETEVYRGASSSQIKPVHVISNEKQRKFFAGMRNPW